MKICVIGGGGAIGGYLAVMLARAGNEVTVVARGATLAAIKERGLALIMDDQPEPLVAEVKAVEKIRDAETPDVVILAVKAHQVEPIIDDLAAIMGPETILIPMQNGIPWWDFQKLGGEYQQHYWLRGLPSNLYSSSWCDSSRGRQSLPFGRVGRQVY